VVAWANLVEQYFSRGDRVYIEVEIQPSSYEHRDGATKYVTEIRARELVMLGGAERRDSAGSATAEDLRREPVAAGKVNCRPSGPRAAGYYRSESGKIVCPSRTPSPEARGDGVL
jgi:single-stranded DNA-binding protein